MTDKKFIDGLIVKAKHERAPEYVLCKLSIKRDALIAWLTQQDGEWINADIKAAQSGKLYAQVDDWKPDGQRGQAPRRQTVNERFEEVRHQRIGSLKRDMPNNDFRDDDIPW